MIKYLGSKRTLVGVLGAIAQAAEAKTAIDMFTGTTRVAQEFKKQGLEVIASDAATYSDVLAKCYIEADANQIDLDALQEKIDYLNRLPGLQGYVTENFCIEARFFQPKNGERIDAIREELAKNFGNDEHYYILLTALMLAADRVDSTTGQHMAYLKSWSHRSKHDLVLQIPELIGGTGRSVLGLAEEFKRDGISVNALWPRTAIDTAALAMIPGIDTDFCRKPEIISDSAHVILTGTGKTGNFFIDDEVLASVGITDLDKYSVVPGTTEFLLDFFID